MASIKKRAVENEAVKPSFNKSLMILVVTIVAVGLLLLLVMFGKQFVGKAFYDSTGTGIRAGIVDPGGIIANTPFSLTVKANIDDKKTVAVGFTLNLPEGVVCDDVTDVVPAGGLDGWGVIPEDLDSEIERLLNAAGLSLTSFNCDTTTTTTTTTNKLFYSIATLDASTIQSGEFEIAEINFEGLQEGSYNFDFENFDIVNLDDANYIGVTTEDATVEVSAEAEIDTDGDGVADDVDECDDTPAGAQIVSNGCMLGDVNNNNLINALDIIPIANQILGRSNIERNGLAADTNCDQNINALDIIPLADLILGRLSEIHCSSVI